MASATGRVACFARIRPTVAREEGDRSCIEGFGGEGGEGDMHPNMRLNLDEGGDAINRILDNTEFAYGAYAALCGVVILLTSLDWVRRHAFEVFYWLHYTFFGFYVFVLLHARSHFMPFFIVTAAAYVVDRVIRATFGLLPTRAAAVRVRGAGTRNAVVQLKVAMPALARKLNRYHVNQYVFLNVPAISISRTVPPGGTRLAF